MLGILGWILFHIHQASSIRTSAAGFIPIFLDAIILQAIAYFLPIYFQAVKKTSPLISEVYFLPFALAIIPADEIARLEYNFQDTRLFA